MPKCNNCGSFVTPDFARVFGDNRNDVSGCVACMSFRELQNGEGATVPLPGQNN
jgi:hypothetical protein